MLKLLDKLLPPWLRYWAAGGIVLALVALVVLHEPGDPLTPPGVAALVLICVAAAAVVGALCRVLIRLIRTLRG